MPAPSGKASWDGGREKGGYCGESLAKLERDAAGIRALEISEGEKAVLLEMNANARRSVELACGAEKALAGSRCRRELAAVDSTEAEIKGLDIGEGERAALLEMNDNVRRGVELSCGLK